MTISDEEIKDKCNAKGVKEGIFVTFNPRVDRIPHVIQLTRYEAFRFSRFLENAILESCKLSGETIDKEFAR